MLGRIVGWFVGVVESLRVLCFLLGSVHEKVGFFASCELRFDSLFFRTLLFDKHFLSFFVCPT